MTRDGKEPSAMRPQLSLRYVSFVIIACSLVISAMGLASILLSSRQSDRDRQPMTGKHLPDSVGLNYSAHDRTVLILLHSSCRYCQRSWPQLRDVAKACKESPSTVCAAASVERPDRFAQYLKAARVEVDQQLQLYPIHSFGGYTPRVLVIDREGTIRLDWLGQVTEAGAKAVLQAINGSGQEGSSR